jgi:MoaA/NifB/PqqE/SkfB family radical SAM enzyme
MSIRDLSTQKLNWIKWRVTYKCNYKCSYCMQQVCERRGEEGKPFEIEPIVRKLIHTSPRKVGLELIGGEVSLIDLCKLLETISKEENLVKVKITTNFSAPVTYYKNLASLVPLSITPSYHPEYNPSVSDFLDKIEAVGKENIAFVEGVVNDSTKEKMEELVAECKQRGIKFCIDIDRFKPELAAKYAYLIEQSSEEYIEGRMEVEGERFPTKTQYMQSGYAKHLGKGRFPWRTWAATKHRLCTILCDYIFVTYEGYTNTCYAKYPEKGSQYTWKDTPSRCPIDYCSFCGRMSVLDEGDDWYVHR